MIVTVNKGFERLTLNGDHLNAHIFHPDEVKISPLERQVLTGNVDPPMIVYDGVGVSHRTVTDFPNVTYFHLAVAQVLRDRGIKPKSFADLGCGVGFLGNYATKKLDAEKVFFTDLSPYSTNHVLRACKFNNPDARFSRESEHDFLINNGASRMFIRIGDASKTLSSEKVDVATCAPYFIPWVCEVYPKIYGIFAGLAKNIGADLYIGHSNLAYPNVLMAAEKHGFDVECLFEQTMPLPFSYGDGSVRSKRQNPGRKLLPVIEERLRRRGLGVHGKREKEYTHQIQVSRLFLPIAKQDEHVY